jgi:hypothetical protein
MSGHGCNMAAFGADRKHSTSCRRLDQQRSPAGYGMLWHRSAC